MEIKICVICEKEFIGHGNNPEPIKDEGQCCDSCNFNLVIPKRVEQGDIIGMTENVYSKYEKEIIEVINIIEPLNFIGVSKIIDAYLFNKNIHLQDSELMDFTHKIKHNLIHYRV